MSQEILVIWNPNASQSAAAAELRTLLDYRDDVRLEEPASEEESRQLLADACHQVACVVAAGGDGTVHGVINMLHQQQCRTPLGIIPLGTANDLCRTLAIPFDPRDAFDAIERQVVRNLDLVRLTSGPRTEVFANIATGGNSERVQEELTPELKQSWGPFAYLRGAFEVVRDLQAYDLKIAFDDEPEETVRAWSIIIANGRTGGATPVAPKANPEDGLLDVVIVLEGTAADFASTAAEFFIGDYLEHENVVYRQATKLTLETDPPLNLSADGEAFETQPFKCELLPGALPVIVGAEYRASGAV